MKIYTRTGDQGTTALFGGERLAKNHPRVAAYGTVDEVNSCVGLVRTACRDNEALAVVDDILGRVQGELFILGADLATPTDAKPHVARIGDAQIRAMEADIDRLDADLPELRHFVLPGGAAAAAWLHLARTIARRAERATVEASTLEPINDDAIRYLNRLSDMLFVMARWVNHRLGEVSPIWMPPSA